MTIGRLHYDGGGDWYANPSSLPNLLDAIRARTTLRVAPQERVVTLRDDDLWNLPYIYMTGHGNVRFSDQDLATLRQYLRQGGFLHADDNYGMDESIRRELARLFPGQDLVEVPLDHPIYRMVYDFPEGHSQDPRARQEARPGIRHLPRRPPGRLLLLSDGSGRRLGGSGGPSRSVGEARGRAPHGRQPLRVRRGVRRMTGIATARALHRLSRPLRLRAGAGWLALGLGAVALLLGSIAWADQARMDRRAAVGPGGVDRRRGGARCGGVARG